MMRTRSYCTVLLILSFCLSLGGNLSHGEEIPDLPPVFPLEIAWERLLSSPPSAGAAMDNLRIYVPLKAGRLEAIARETGETLWSIPLHTMWSPVIDSTGRLFVATDFTIRALEASTGSELWNYRSQQRLSSAPLLAGHSLVITTMSREVLSFQVSSGEFLWQSSLEGSSLGHAATTDQSLIVFSQEGGLLTALQLNNGATAWSKQISGNLSAPVSARDRIFVGSTENFFYALNPRNGSELWKWRTGGDVIGAAADEDLVYFLSLDNVIRAVNRSNGNQKWKATMSTRPVAPPRITTGAVVVSGVPTQIYGYVSDTGLLQGSYLPLAALQEPLLIDQELKSYRAAVFTLTRNGQLVGLRPIELMFRDPVLEPLSRLPGRFLQIERFPSH
tara:strand:+ start:2069 stop:3235 length:1167 start_codon:yes stop_codon:yes gene_type:complete